MQTMQVITGCNQRPFQSPIAIVSYQLDPSCMKALQARALAVLMASAKKGEPFMTKDEVRLQIGVDFKKVEWAFFLERGAFEPLRNGAYTKEEGGAVSITRAGEDLYKLAMKVKPELFAVSNSPTPDLEKALAKVRAALGMKMT